MQSGPHESMPDIVQPLGGISSRLTTEWEDSYQSLPLLFLALFVVWVLLVLTWVANTWAKRRWQCSNLQWALTAVPLLKGGVLGLSFIFWYSCLHLGTCSFWMAFGVFVSRIFFETATVIAFLLIAHGYCLTHAQLAPTERRSIAGLASLLYLTLTGYKAAVPHFAILVCAVYAILLYAIFSRAARNVALLKEQLASIATDGTPDMQSALHAKYCMFRRYQVAMLLLVGLEILVHVRAEGVSRDYWLRLLFHECTEAAIFCFVGWTFRSRAMTPFFSVIPAMLGGIHYRLPPIHRVEMNEKDFKGLEFKQWQIGVPTTPPSAGLMPVLVIIRNPGGCPSPAAKPKSDPTMGFPMQATRPQATPIAEPAGFRHTRSTLSSGGCLPLVPPRPSTAALTPVKGGFVKPLPLELGGDIDVCVDKQTVGKDRPQRRLRDSNDITNASRENSVTAKSVARWRLSPTAPRRASSDSGLLANKCPSALCRLQRQGSQAQEHCHRTGHAGGSREGEVVVTIVQSQATAQSKPSAHTPLTVV